MTSLDQPRIRSPDFCWDTVVFEVEDTVFRVPRFAFTASSPLFETMFLLPAGEGDEELEGGSDQHPITLESYKAADFDALLRVLYPTSHTLLAGGITLSKEQWIGVLRLSTIWEMKEIREFTIKQLSTASPPLSPVEKVNFGRDHRVVSWFVEGLMALTWVDRQLSPDALGEAVGLGTALRIYGARLRQTSNHAKILPITVPSGHRTGIAVADLCYSCCWKPAFMDDVKSCHSCSSARVANESGAVYVAAMPTMHTTGGHCYFHISIPDIRCASCHNQFITETVICPSCNAPTLAGHLHIYLGRHSSLIPSTESLIREIFEDEIREYEV